MSHSLEKYKSGKFGIIRKVTKCFFLMFSDNREVALFNIFIFVLEKSVSKAWLSARWCCRAVVLLKIII